MHTKTIAPSRKDVFLAGLRAGIPIGLGYFAVSFSLGFAAYSSGLNAFQAFFASLFCNASAGEKAGFDMIKANATYIEMAIMIFIANARYLLMSCALGQRIDEKTGILHRLLLGMYVTDEFFGIAIAREGKVDPFYTYGAVSFAAPCWAVGTALGATLGNLLPTWLVSAFAVTLYGMFIAIIIPPAKKDRIVAALVAVSFVLSTAATYIPAFSGISSGTKTIILTVAISGAAALLFPVAESDVAEGGDAK